MPELPEVETTRRGIEPHAVGRRIVELRLYEKRLRWKVQEDLPDLVAGQVIRHAKRRAKYLLLELDSGTLMLHLGMSGSLRVLPADVPLLPHDHFDIVLSSGNTLRFNDPRRFGSLHYETNKPNKQPKKTKQTHHQTKTKKNAVVLSEAHDRNGQWVVLRGSLHAPGGL